MSNRLNAEGVTRFTDVIEERNDSTTTEWFDTGNVSPFIDDSIMWDDDDILRMDRITSEIALWLEN